MMMNSQARTRSWAISGGVLGALLLAGCSGGDEPAASEDEMTNASAAEAEHEDDEHGDTDEHDDDNGDSNAAEVESASPRLVATYDGGVLVIDGTTLEVLDSFEMPGFNRLNPAGDGRHVLISTADAFVALDTGAWSEEHGDHPHHYAGDPALTDIAFEADHPGHVVRHAGRTVLFSDGSGRVEIFESDALDDGRPETEIYTADEPHHGVAVELDNGELLVTIGDEESRTGIKVLDEDREEIARSEQCPGVHGEAMAEGEAVVIGCEDGVLVYQDGEIGKIDSPDEYGRIGNHAGSEESPVVLGDYKVDPDAELERPERISLIDTTTNTLQLVDLSTSYSFRSLARGPHGEALVLGTDGAIHVVDPESAEVTSSIPVVDAWEEPLVWQEPRPTIFVNGHTAYVTEPAANEIHAVDIHDGEITASATLPQTPNELTGVPG